MAGNPIQPPDVTDSAGVQGPERRSSLLEALHPGASYPVVRIG
jgi:hypothetical protein